MPSHASRYRLVRRAALVVPALVGALLVVPPPGIAHAEATTGSGLRTDIAFEAGRSAEAPVASATVGLPDGDVVLGGTFTQATTFGATVLDPVSPGARTGFVARYSADGADIRWVRSLDAAMRPVALVAANDVVVVTTSSLAPTTSDFSSWTFGLNLVDGSYRWADTFQAVHDYCVPPDMATAEDDTVVVLDTVASRDGSGSHCSVVLRSLDGSTGSERWSRSIGGTGDVFFDHVAVAPDGQVFATGFLTGGLTIAGEHLNAPNGYYRPLVAGFGPDGSEQWVHASETWTTSGNPGFDDVLFVAGRLLAWSHTRMLPDDGSFGARWLVALDAASGSGLWQRSTQFSGTYQEYPEPGSLAVGPDDTAVLVAPFLRFVDLGNGMTLTGTALEGPEQYDAAVVGIRVADGQILYAERVGGEADDRVWAASFEGRSLVVAGALGVERSDGTLADRVSYARLELPSDVGVRVSADAAEVGQTVYATVATTSGTPLSSSVSGPCELLWGQGVSGSVQLLHVGACTVTVAQEVDGILRRASATITVEPLTPRVIWTPGSITYPEPLGTQQLSARVVDRQYHDLTGSITYSEEAGSVLGAGWHALTLTFRSGSPDVRDATDSRSIYVSPGRPEIRWPGTDHLVYGLALPAAVVEPGYAGTIPGRLFYDAGREPGTVLQAGTYTAHVGFDSQDPNYMSRWTEFTFTVERANSRLDARFGKLQGQLTAVLRDTSNATTLPGQAVVFYFGNKACTVMTDSTGTATCTLSALDYVTARRRGVNAIYSGNTNHDQASAWLPAG